jgi:hypothetical protein
LALSPGGNAKGGILTDGEFAAAKQMLLAGG